MNFNALFLNDPLKFSIENIIYDPLLFGSIRPLYRDSGVYNFSILDLSSLKKFISDKELGKKNLFEALEGAEFLLKQRQPKILCKYLIVDNSINFFPKIKGYYFPYYSDSIGFIDIPIYPQANEGKFAFTAYLSGCTICVKKHLDQKHFRVFHVPSSINSTKSIDKKYWIELQEKYNPSTGFETGYQSMISYDLDYGIDAPSMSTKTAFVFLYFDMDEKWYYFIKPFDPIVQDIKKLFSVIKNQTAYIPDSQRLMVRPVLKV